MQAQQTLPGHSATVVFPAQLVQSAKHVARSSDPHIPETDPSSCAFLEAHGQKIHICMNFIFFLNRNHSKKKKKLLQSCICTIYYHFPLVLAKF